MSVFPRACRVLIILSVVLMLTACGYRTDLELPDDNSAHAPDSLIVPESILNT